MSIRSNSLIVFCRSYICLLILCILFLSIMKDMLKFQILIVVIMSFFFCPCSVNFEDLLLAPFRILTYLDFITMQLMSLFIPDNILCSDVDFT